MADYRSTGTKFPNLVKMFGGKAIIFLAILTGGQLDKLLILLCAILLIICCPKRKPAKVRATGNCKKRQAKAGKAKEDAPYPDETTIRQMVIMEDAMSALKHLGYTKSEAKAALQAVSGQGYDTLDTLIMAALRQGR